MRNLKKLWALGINELTNLEELLARIKERDTLQKQLDELQNTHEKIKKNHGALPFENEKAAKENTIEELNNIRLKKCKG